MPDSLAVTIVAFLSSPFVILALLYLVVAAMQLVRESLDSFIDYMLKDE